MRLIRPSRSQYQLAAFLVSLAAVAASIHSSTARAADQPPEAVLLLQGTLGAPIRITESEFKKLPHVEVEAVDHGGHKGRYSGVPLRVLLDKLDVPRGEKLRGDWLGANLAGQAPAVSR